MQNYNPTERACMVLLYGLVFQEGVEIGRVLLDKKLLSGKEYDLYVNQANQLVDEKFLNEWETESLQPVLEILKLLEKDSNRGKGINLKK